MITRDLIAQAFPANKRLQRAFEEQAKTVDETADKVASNLDATDALNAATVVVLSPNAAFTNERVLRLGSGLAAEVDDAYVTISIDPAGAAKVEGGYDVILRSQGVTELILPMTGTVATRAGAETLESKTLKAPKLAGLVNAANDGAAAGAGVPVGGMYHDAGALRVRVA